ncbi:MAG: stage II sporulation protein P [Clostridia bacterium]
MHDRRFITIWRPGHLARRPRHPRPKPRRPRPEPTPDPFWGMLWSYATVAALGLLVLTVVSQPSPRTVPAMAHLAGSKKAAGLTRWLRAIRVPTRPVRDWFTDGAPLTAWLQGQLTRPWPVHWDSLVSATVATVTATPLSSLNQLLYAAVPSLAAAKTIRPEPELPQEAFAVDPSIPGAHGRVWAVLGQRPEVGIYQTESHQSFWSELPKGATAAYSTNWPQTVVQVGWWLTQDLHASGVNAVQSRVDNMRQGLLGSYGLSLQTARTLLKWWPSIRVLLDVQRGTAGRGSTVAVVHGVKTARIRFVVGTNQLLAQPHWHENLQFAVALANELKRLAPGILRQDAVDTVPYRYNQQLLPGDLVVDVGGPDNTLLEERRAVYELAQAVADLVRAGKVP